jgi:hypothetical protein
MALGYATTLRNTRLDAITTAVGNAGKLRIYSGTRPATGGAVTTLLAELICGSPFAPAASGGVLTPNALTQDSAADNTGTATWFRVVTSANAFVFDGDVAASGSDLNLTSTSIITGGTVSVSTFTITGGNP